MPNETINLPLTKIEDFDFASYPSLDMNDMDFDADSPTDMPAMFYPGGSSSQFISPNTLVASNASPATSKPVPRIFPGMHQQAAQAKAQQAQKQQEMMGQQQQPIRQIPGQKPLPKGQPNKDPQVEESISRILSEMRQKSVASTAEDGDSPLPSISNMARLKKEEDDMDEDERLLASEEGKKLSSKERRQLRNKVSARAFRSRRKGTCCLVTLLSTPTDRFQNTSDNLKVISPTRRTRPMLLPPRTAIYEKKTTALPTSPACFFRPKLSPASCKSSASPAYRHWVNSKYSSNSNRARGRHRISISEKTSIPVKLLDKCKANNNHRSAWY